MELVSGDILGNRLTICGPLCGGMKETQEMLEFCGQHGIACDVETIEATPETIESAYERVLKSDVKFRFVLNMKDAFPE